MAKSKNTNPNVYRAKWDMQHDLDTDYSRSKNKKELEELINENTGSLSNDEDEDLKPFWEEEGEEDSEERNKSSEKR